MAGERERERGMHGNNGNNVHKYDAKIVRSMAVEEKEEINSDYVHQQHGNAAKE